MPIIPNNKLSTLPKRLQALFGMVEEVPDTWFMGNGKAHGTHPRRASTAHGGELEPIPCTSYAEVVAAWSEAMEWRDAMDDVLCTMLAVAISTEQVGDQLFLKVIGDAGSGKTRFCEGLLVSRSCYPLEHLTGFHSGWKGGSENGQDFSLLSRINRKTLITPEGDVLISSPQFQQIMSQQRRIFDGTSGADYKNMSESQRYTGLRTPWIIAGTPALLDADQSRLGDRFIKVYFQEPDDEQKQRILMRVARSALKAVKLKSEEGDAEKQLQPEMAYAYQLTGGYVDWLKSNTALIDQIDMSDDHLFRCTVLAEFAASMRASQPKENHPTVELPTRLTHQMVRLACCKAVVLNKREVDYDVMRRVRKIAVDTSRGPNLDVVRLLIDSKFGAEVRGISNSTHYGEDRCRSLMRFLGHVGVVNKFTGALPKGYATGQRYQLTPKMRKLYTEVQP